MTFYPESANQSHGGYIVTGFDNLNIHPWRTVTFHHRLITDFLIFHKKNYSACDSWRTRASEAVVISHQQMRTEPEIMQDVFIHSKKGL
jgi:hypothetical protein